MDASLGKTIGVGCHTLLQGGLPDPGVKPVPLTFPPKYGAPKGLARELGCAVQNEINEEAIRGLLMRAYGHFSENQCL